MKEKLQDMNKEAVKVGLKMNASCPGVDSASNRNKYQESFLGVKTAGA
jgi:hypothetical protein